MRCSKLEGAIVEWYEIGMTLVSGKCTRTEGKLLDVEPVSVRAGVSHRDVVFDVVEPNFDCWRVDSPTGGHVEKGKRMDEADTHEEGSKCVMKHGLGVVVGGERWPVLFSDLLDLSTTQPTEDEDPEAVSDSDKMREAFKRIAELEDELRQKLKRVRELEVGLRA